MTDINLPNALLNIIKPQIENYNEFIEFTTKNNTSKICQIYFSDPFHKYLLNKNSEKRKFYSYLKSREKRKTTIYKEIETVEKSIDWEFLNSKINFGKYKGTTFYSIPNDYKNWLLKNNVLKDEKKNNALILYGTYKNLKSEESHLMRDSYD